MNDQNQTTDNTNKRNTLKCIGYFLGTTTLVAAAYIFGQGGCSRNDDIIIQDNRTTNNGTQESQKNTNTNDGKTETKKRIDNDSIDTHLEGDKTKNKVVVITDRRHTSEKRNAGEPCVYQNKTDENLYLRYSGTAGGKTAVWLENHDGWIRVVPIDTKRDNVFKEWNVIGKKDLQSFYELCGPNYHINGRPGYETMSDSANSKRLEQNLKNYDKSYVPRSGIRQQTQHKGQR